MNYRHSFHAGNFADVLKHAALVAVILYLQKKPAPLAVIDSHAGAGLYDLSGDAARTGEAQEGILRLLAEPDLPGVLAYGSTRDEAVAKAKALAFRVLADRLEHGEEIPQIHGVFAVHE